MRHFIEVERPGTLSPSELRLLQEKTEGWPAALRVVTSTSIQLDQDFGQYVRNLSGAQRPIGAYLEEMLDGLPRDMVQFMLRTAVLNRLCAPLCEVVTGANSGQELLRSIEQRQLLLLPLDQEGQWYRYHPLLAEYLSLRLESEHGNEIPGLHQRASLWYAAQELWTEAVQHAFAAGDAIRALGWIKNCAMPLVKRGDLFTLLGWQRLFPTGLLTRGQPEVGLAIAWGMALAVRYDESLALLSEVERDISADHSHDPEAFRCEYDTIRSVALALKDDSEAALSIAQDCLGRSADPWTANVASNVVRFGRLKRGDLREFHATPWISYSIDEDRRNVFASVYYRCLQGMAEAQQLRFASADRHYLDALRLAEQHVGPNSVAAALPASLIARIRYEQGRLDEAEALLIYRVPLINAGTLLDCVLSAYSVMARIAVHRMNVEWAHTLLELAENQGNARGWGRLSAAAVLERARLFLNEGRIDEGAGCIKRLERLAAEYPAPTHCAWSDIHRYAAFGRAYLASAEERFEDAISILSGLQHEFESVGNRHLALRVQAHLATVRFRAKQVAEAVDCRYRNHQDHRTPSPVRRKVERLAEALRKPEERDEARTLSVRSLKNHSHARRQARRIGGHAARRPPIPRGAGYEHPGHHNRLARRPTSQEVPCRCSPSPCGPAGPPMKPRAFPVRSTPPASLPATLRTICSSAFFHSNQATSGWTRDTRRCQRRAQAKCSSSRSWCHQVRRPSENERSSKALWSTSPQPGSTPTTSWCSSWKPTVRTDRSAGASLLLPLH
jgi:LuxR family maltose regulon positive regulatory protein